MPAENRKSMLAQIDIKDKKISRVSVLPIMINKSGSAADSQERRSAVRRRGHLHPRDHRKPEHRNQIQRRRRRNSLWHLHDFRSESDDAR